MSRTTNTNTRVRRDDLHDFNRSLSERMAHVCGGLWSQDPSPHWEAAGGGIAGTEIDPLYTIIVQELSSPAALLCDVHEGAVTKDLSCHDKHNCHSCMFFGGCGHTSAALAANWDASLSECPSTVAGDTIPFPPGTISDLESTVAPATTPSGDAVSYPLGYITEPYGRKCVASDGIVSMLRQQGLEDHEVRDELRSIAQGERPLTPSESPGLFCSANTCSQSRFESCAYKYAAPERLYSVMVWELYVPAIQDFPLAASQNRDIPADSKWHMIERSMMFGDLSSAWEAAQALTCLTHIPIAPLAFSPELLQPIRVHEMNVPLLARSELEYAIPAVTAYGLSTLVINRCSQNETAEHLDAVGGTL